MTRTVRLTIWPKRVLAISDAEYLDLKRRNMILEDVAPEQVSEPEPAPETSTPPLRRGLDRGGPAARK